MEYIKVNDTYIVRLTKGDEILTELNNLAVKENINCAIVTGIGATNEATFGVFRTKTKEYVKQTKSEDMEITALNGNISREGDNPYMHLHITLASENSCFGGHLNKAVISATAEIFVRVMQNKVDRFFDADTGLKLMKF